MPIEEDVIVGEIPKNNREDIRVTLSNFKGHDLVGARIWFKTKDGESRPSNKGITVNVKVLPELIGLLEQAEKKAIELGVLDAEDGVPPPPDEDAPPF
jgi:hypothetical protein